MPHDTTNITRPVAEGGNTRVYGALLSKSEMCIIKVDTDAVWLLK